MKINRAQFLALARSKQNRLLLRMAEHSLPLLAAYPTVHGLVRDSLKLASQYLDSKLISALEVSRYFDPEDMDQDLGMQIYNVNNDQDAVAAVDLACYASGAISRQAFEDAGFSTHMPEAVQEAIPEVVVDALPKYLSLLEKGLVKDIPV